MTVLARSQSLAALTRRLDLLASRLQPPAVPLTALDLAGLVGLQLDGWQVTAAQSTAPRILFAAGRQVGKSTVMALRGLHLLLTEPKALILVVAPGERQAKLLAAKIHAWYLDLGRPVPALVESTLHLHLINGAELYVLPGAFDRVRGFAAPRAILLDEAARVPDLMMLALRPMMATATVGTIIAASSPWGKTGWFWQAWSAGGDDWQRFHIPASQCKRISPEFLRAEKRALPDLWYRSEYDAEFIDIGTSSFFDPEDVARCFRPGIGLLMPEEDADTGWSPGVVA